MNFDRVAAVYDNTRTLPAEVSERIADGIVHAVGAGPSTRFLEPGIGTGRMALPLAARGFPYTGIDISEAMMDRLRMKAADRDLRLTLVHGDVTALPFPDHSFDVVLVAHLLHLVPEWRTSLAEARRVTVEGGHFVMAGNHYPAGDPGYAIRQMWHTFAVEAGAELRPSYGSWDAVDAELTALGCYTAVYRVAQWGVEFVPIELINRQRDRTFSHSWTVSDEVMEAVHQRLLAWAREEYGDLERPILERQEFWVSASRWPA